MHFNNIMSIRMEKYKNNKCDLQYCLNVFAKHKNRIVGYAYNELFTL